MEADVKETYYTRFLREIQRGLKMRRKEPTAVSSIASIDGVDSSKIRNFPYSSLKLLGGLQIGVGGTCIILGLIDLFLFLYVSPDYKSSTLTALTIASLPIWCGLWFIVSGSMGSCMSLNQKTTLAYFKVTFLVLSLMCCILFGPALCAVEIYIVVLRTEKSENAYEWLLPLLICFCAFIEIIFGIITSSICCCCSPLSQAKVRVLYSNKMEEYPSAGEKRRLETPEIFYVEPSKYESHQRPPVNHARAIEDAPARERNQVRAIEDATVQDKNWDGGTNLKQPRVVSADSPPLRHYPRPPTYDPNNLDNNYERLKALTFPRY